MLSPSSLARARGVVVWFAVAVLFSLAVASSCAALHCARRQAKCRESCRVASYAALGLPASFGRSASLPHTPTLTLALCSVPRS